MLRDTTHDSACVSVTPSNTEPTDHDDLVPSPWDGSHDESAVQGSEHAAWDAVEPDVQPKSEKKQQRIDTRAAELRAELLAACESCHRGHGNTELKIVLERCGQASRAVKLLLEKDMALAIRRCNEVSNAATSANQSTRLPTQGSALGAVRRCIMCKTQAADSVLVHVAAHLAHQCCCFSCAHMFQGPGALACPTCERIVDVIARIE